MLEIGRIYSIAELCSLLGANGKQGLTRKMRGYGITYHTEGRGEKLTFTITDIEDPFKLFAIMELNFSANTDFRKLRLFYYYYFNDELFMTMPDEVKENMLTEKGNRITRQTISSYLAKLEAKNLIHRESGNYIYYFALKNKQRFVERAEYTKAWKEYWKVKSECGSADEAIFTMIHNYGGVARKQQIPDVNGIYRDTIEKMLSFIQVSMEKELIGREIESTN